MIFNNVDIIVSINCRMPMANNAKVNYTTVVKAPMWYGDEKLGRKCCENIAIIKASKDAKKYGYIPYDYKVMPRLNLGWKKF